MAKLLVSVRTVAEAQAAWSAGATVIDIKEPARGPLGCADPATWRAVRQALPPEAVVSVALGELVEWADRPAPEASAWQGIAFRKLGLAGAGGPDWSRAWSDLRRSWRPGPAWVAVAYADWLAASAPAPDDVLEEAITAGCAGVLVDTWSKTRSGNAILSNRCDWSTWIDRARRAGLFVALAGGLDMRTITILRDLDPDLFGVRGAACRGGRREGEIQPRRVARLAQVAAGQRPTRMTSGSPKAAGLKTSGE